MRMIVLYLATAFLISSQAWCGTGSYIANTIKPDEIQLKVNLEFPQTPDGSKDWEPLFTEASRLLFDATEKQIKISKVTFYENCPEMSDQADVRIASGEMSASTTRPPGGFGHEALSIHLSQLHKGVTDPKKRGQFGLVHELGHYLFALLDEYLDKSGIETPLSNCIKATPTDIDMRASIMDGGTTIEKKNQRTEFCVAETHNTGMTQQDLKRVIDGNDFENTDDWTWIKAWMAYRFGTTLDAPKGQPTSDPAGFGKDPDFQVVSCGLRAAVGIDKSGSMSSSPAFRQQDRAGFKANAKPMTGNSIDAVKAGADTFIRLLKENDFAGIVETGGETQKVPFRAMSIDNKFETLSDIPPIRVGGNAGWIDLLRESFAQINDGHPASGSETIVLLSDGRQGPEEIGHESSASLLSAIKRRGVVVHAIGVDNEEAADLRKAATETGGNYLFSRTTSQVNAAAMTLIAQLKRRGVIEAREGRIEAGKTVSIAVPVDSATTEEEANFLLIWSEPGKDLTLNLTDPQGVVVNPLDPNIGLAHGGRFTRGWVKHPQSGEWKIVIGNPNLSPRDFAFQAHSLARGVTVAGYAEKDVVVYPAPLVLKAAVTAYQPVAGAKVTAQIERPDGERVTVELFDDGDFQHRDEQANDGAYSNLFKDYKGSGSYNVEISASSEGGFTVPLGEQGKPITSLPVQSFTRKVRFSVVVQGAPN